MNESDPVSITSVRFRNVKTLRDFAINLGPMNVAVGPNNSGKSTIIGSFRVLAAGLAAARAKSPDLLGGHLRRGWRVADALIPISMENIHTDYQDVDSTVTFRLSNKNELVLVFPSSGGAILHVGAESKQVTRPAEFRLYYPVQVSVVPELGPLEHEEEIVLEETVRRGLTTHRASRHFRNYWRYFPNGFDDFRAALQRTWPGADIEPPRLENPLDTKLTMFSREGTYLRELYWAGFGFQVWCQLLTHLNRAQGSTMLLVDEPETYLHPVLQRQILHLLREAESDVFIATHSSEIVAEAEPSEILIIDRNRRFARRAADLAGVQSALTHIGSGRNVVLTQLARTSHALLVEGDDFTVLRAIARVLGLTGISTGSALTAIPLDGFPTAERLRSLAQGIREAIGPDVFLAACFDRDNRCDDEVEEFRAQFAKAVDQVHVLRMHEIENYLLAPALIERAIARQSRRNADRPPLARGATELLMQATERLRDEVVATRGAERARYLRSAGVSILTANREAAAEVTSAWPSLEERMRLVPGKEVLSAINQLLQVDGCSVSVQSLVNSLQPTDVPLDLANFLRKVEARLASAPEARLR